MPRSILFSDFEWDIKDSMHGVGPGPNVFSGRTEDIFVDEAGLLNLRTTEHNGTWHSTEAVLSKPLGHGTYEYRVRTPLDSLDPQAVFSGFIYQDDLHEFDIEFSKRMVGGGGAQFVVQPLVIPGHRKRFASPAGPSVHRIAWEPGLVRFESEEAGTGATIWTYAGRRWMPDPARALFIFNLWLYRGRAPQKHDEVVVESFTFVPFAT